MKKLSIFNLKFSRLFCRRRAAVSLMTILILAGILLEIVTMSLATSFLSGERGLGMRAHYTAFYAARTGVNDVVMRVIRNRAFVPGTNPYSITLQNSSASVYVTRTLPDANHIQYTIASTGSSGIKKIKITSTVIIDDSDGSISSQTIVESGI